MPAYIWERCDTFQCGQEYGIVLDDNGNALIVTHKSLSKYNIETGPVPADALPAQILTMPLEIQMALKGAAVASKLTPCLTIDL
jgi:hypothetical protein